MYECKKCKIREIDQLIGTLIAACPGAKYGMLYTKRLERDKYHALLNNNNNFNKKMIVSREMKADIIWWINNVSITKNPIRESIYRIEIFSDASLSGWGVVCGKQKIHGW